MPSLRLRPELPSVFASPRHRKTERYEQRLRTSHPQLPRPPNRTRHQLHKALTTLSAISTSFSLKTTFPLAAPPFWHTSIACSSAPCRRSTPTTPPVSSTARNLHLSTFPSQTKTRTPAKPPLSAPPRIPAPRQNWR